MTSGLISRDGVMNILKSLQDKRHNPCAYAELEVARNKICELPTVEVIDVHSDIDINNEVLTVRKPPECYIKGILARGLSGELEKYITVKKHPGMFHNTVFHARVNLVMLKGEQENEREQNNG